MSLKIVELLYMNTPQNNDLQKLSLDQLKEIYDLYCQTTYISSSVIKDDWIPFQYDALTIGVSQFDIDMISLNDDDFAAKYST